MARKLYKILNEYYLPCQIYYYFIRSNNFLVKKFRNLISIFRINSDFIFLNYQNISEEETILLQGDNVKKERLDNIARYTINGLDKKIIIFNLQKKDLYKINFILDNEIYEDENNFTYGTTLKEILSKINNNGEKVNVEDYKLSLMNQYLKNIYNNNPNRYISPFLNIYKKTEKNIIGETILDIGSCSGFFPMVIKKINPRIKVTASDKTVDGLLFLKRFSYKKNVKINILKLNILKNINHNLKFDTVTSMHVLEHVPEESNFDFINNCLKLSNKRVIIVVPIEKNLTSYEHKQLFDKKKLIDIGDKTGLNYSIKILDAKNIMLILDKDI